MRPVAQALPACLMSLATAVAALCVLPLLGPLFADADWWRGPASAVLLLAVVGAAAQWVRLSAVATPVLQLVALTAAVTARHAPDAALLGVLPTPAAATRLAGLVLAGVLDIRTNVIPVPATDGIVLLVTLLLGVLTVSAHLMAVALRVPGVAGAALLSLVAVPLTVHHEGVGWSAFATAATGFLLLFAVDSAARAAAWGPRTAPRSGWSAVAAGLWGLGAAGTAAVCVVLALLVPALMPGLASGSVFSLVEQLRAGGRTVTTVDPLTSLRGSLSSNGDRRVLEYHTSDPDPEYLRTHVLDTFDGETWTMSPVEAVAEDRLNGTIPRSPGLSGGSAGSSVTTDVTVSAEVRGMDFLPLPYPSSDVQVPGEWYVDPDTLMVFSPDGEAAGLTYRVTSTASTPDGDALRSAAPSASLRVDQRYLDLPPLSAEVARLTEDLTADAASPFDQALALQDWFTGGGFTYDLDPPRVPDGADPLAHFLLDSRTGYCQHFASAMAVMARHLGIPARVAVGYTAGEHVGSDRWTVRESDAHAWPELYFAGYGWLRFEPTPGSGQPNAAPPDYAAAAPERTPAGEPRETAGPEPSAAPERTPAREPRETAGEESRDGERFSADPAADADPLDGGRRAAASAVAAAVAAALLAVPALLRRLVRALRWRRSRDAAESARAAWAELRDDLVDLGWEWNPAHSPRTVERLLLSREPVADRARAALHRIVAAEEAARYAPQTPAVPDLAEDCRTVRRALAASSPPLSRVRALLLPRSLWTARPRRADARGMRTRGGRGAHRDPHA